jgi:hypothetical protein
MNARRIARWGSTLLLLAVTGCGTPGVSPGSPGSIGEQQESVIGSPSSNQETQTASYWTTWQQAQCRALEVYHNSGYSLCVGAVAHFYIGQYCISGGADVVFRCQQDMSLQAAEQCKEVDTLFHGDPAVLLKQQEACIPAPPEHHFMMGSARLSAM